MLDAETGNDPDDGFILVSHKRNRKKAQKSNQSHLYKEEVLLTSFDRMSLSGSPSVADRLVAIERQKVEIMRDIFPRIKRLNFIQRLYSANLKGVVDLVCYGVGSLDRTISQSQFALGLLLMSDLSVRDAFIYDPLMDEHDLAVCKEYKVNVISENEFGKRSVCEHHESADFVLFWMPHCPLGLYDNLLEVNFNRADLSKIIIIGNNFDSYHSRMLDADFQGKSPYIHRLFANDCIEIENFPLQNDNAFSDLSIHRFCESKLPDADDSTFWSTGDVDKLSDSEIVNNKRIYR